MKKIFTFIIFLSVMSAGVTPAVAAVDFTNGFETALYQYPNAVNNWHDPQPYPPGDRLTRVNFPVRTGNWSFKAMVLPGDSYGMSGERAELYGMYGQTGQQLFENENSGTHYYAVSVYLPPSWSPPVTKDPWEPFGIFMQLHGPDSLSCSPSFALNALNTYFLQIHGGDQDGGSNYFTAKYDFGKVNLGQWVDFVFRVTWSSLPSGSVEVWRRNEGQTDFNKVANVLNIPTLQYKSSVDMGEVGNHYWKTGFYRSREQLTNTIFLDSYARGDSFAEVVNAAFPSPIGVVITPVPTTTPVCSGGDLNGDCEVNFLDYSLLLPQYGKTGLPGFSEADINFDGIVNLYDYNLLVTDFGK